MNRAEAASTYPSLPWRILFVCTGNAGRSQIAQALARRDLGNRACVESAGVRPWDHLHPVAVALLRERSLLREDQPPKSAESVAHQTFDLVVTIGDPARSELPARLRRSDRWIHWDISDPADADGTAESPAVFRRTLDEIERRIRDLAAFLTSEGREPVRSRVGVSTGLWWPGNFDPARHLPQAAAAGFDALELNLFLGKHFNTENPSAVSDLRRVVGDLGLAIVSIHAPDGGGLASDSASDRQKQMDILLRHADLAEQLGASVVVTHALIVGSMAADLNVCEERFATALVALAARMEPSPVRIGFENGYDSRPGRAAVEVLRRLGAHSGAAFGFTLDPGHSNLVGDLSAIAAGVGTRLLSLHLNDNDGKKDNHLVPGAGTVDWESVVRLLHATQFGGCLMYEVMGGIERAPEILAQTAQWGRRLRQERATHHASETAAVSGS